MHFEHISNQSVKIMDEFVFYFILCGVCHTLGKYNKNLTETFTTIIWNQACYIQCENNAYVIYFKQIITLLEL